MQYPKLVESRTSANEVNTLEWNPGMDLLATVFNNGALTCSRLLSLQKVWHKQSNGKIISIAWRPDGRVLAIGAYNDLSKEYNCTLHDVEDGKEVYSIKKEREITSVDWFQYVSDKRELEKNEEIAKLKKILMNNEEMTEKFNHQLAHEQTLLNILMISTDDCRISFYALGLFYIGEVVVHNDPDSRIVKAHMSSCLRFVTSIISTKHTSSSLSSSIKVLQFETFHKRSNEILSISKMYAKITDELEYLDDTINAITTSWADVLAGLDNKLSSYCSRQQHQNEYYVGDYTFLHADELLRLLVIGMLSDNLEKFLTDMSDKGLKKLNSAIEQTCTRVQNLIVKNAQKCCYHLHADLNILRGMSLWRERYQHVGLDDKFIVDAMKAVGSLLLKLTELQQVIDHSLKSTKAFFRWLISIACRLTGEQNNSAVSNEINKTTQQDLQLITDFILENFDYSLDSEDLFDYMLSDAFEIPESPVVDPPTCSNFTLEYVAQYFRNKPLSHLKYSFTKPDTNFWIEFFKNRTDLFDCDATDEDGSSVLLLYPHNTTTSLIQEHKNACKAIEMAFESVADNIKAILSTSDDFIHVRDLNRGISGRNVRVETNIKTMEHYTLFQLKAGPVQRQYLITENLEDKTFKMISIEFQPTELDVSTAGTSSSFSKPTSVIQISDSGFYDNKESKKFLLAFLLNDQTLGDTIIVHLPLDKVLETTSCTVRTPKEIAKVFRTNDSIDKHSTRLVLELDLVTMPASERKNKPHFMMVKRIKKTLGRDMFSSGGRGVIAFTSSGNKHMHLYELESAVCGCEEIMDDDVESDDKLDESLIDTDLIN